MNNLYVGIDPSINSSGVCLIYDDGLQHKEEFFVITPKITKKEDALQCSLNNFEYKLYDKHEPNTDDNHENERRKTVNFLRILNIVEEIINDERAKHLRIDHVYVCQEGISYGSSVRTKSIFDLAGLNYMLRMTVMKYKDYDLIIATPGEIKKFATGKGNANKDMMKDVFAAIHPELTVLPKYDDIADAYFMAKYVEYIDDDR